MDKCYIDQLTTQCVHKEEWLISQISDSINLPKLRILKQNKTSKKGSRIRSNMITMFSICNNQIVSQIPLRPASIARRQGITIESIQNSCNRCYRMQFRTNLRFLEGWKQLQWLTESKQTLNFSFVIRQSAHSLSLW